MAIPAGVMKPFSPQRYLELERQAEFKSEYVDGEIVAMSGGSPNHSRIKIALARVVDSQLQGKPCETFDSDMRVLVDPQLYSYPDLSVVCPEGQFDAEAGDNLLNPTVIFEVLSPSTETFDRGKKFPRYRRMPSLRQYVLVSQDAPLVEVFTREGDMWTFAEFAGLGAMVCLASIDCTLALADLYARIAFETPPAAVNGPAGDRS